jgi:hypothetical protein
MIRGLWSLSDHNSRLIELPAAPEPPRRRHGQAARARSVASRSARPGTSASPPRQRDGVHRRQRGAPGGQPHPVVADRVGDRGDPLLRPSSRPDAPEDEVDRVEAGVADAWARVDRDQPTRGAAVEHVAGVEVAVDERDRRVRRAGQSQRERPAARERRTLAVVTGSTLEQVEAERDPLGQRRQVPAGHDAAQTAQQRADGRDARRRRTVSDRRPRLDRLQQQRTLAVVREQARERRRIGGRRAEHLRLAPRERRIGRQLQHDGAPAPQPAHDDRGLAAADLRRVGEDDVPGGGERLGALAEPVEPRRRGGPETARDAAARQLVGRRESHRRR